MTRRPIATNTDIISRMERLTELVQQVNANQQLTQEEEQPPGSNKEELSRSTELLNELAAKVLYRSSIITESVVSESSCRRRALSLVGGEWTNDFGRMQVEAWIPPADQDYSTIRSSAISSSHHGTSIYSVPAESTHFGTAQHEETSVADSISNDDQDIHMIRRVLATGYERFGQGDYQQAAENFKQALECAKGVELEQNCDLDLTHARLKLGLSYLHEGMMNESEQILHDIATEQFVNSVGSAHALDAAYTLARIYLYKDDLDAAGRFCQKARAGRKLIFGEKDPSYFLTLRLLSSIYKARGLPLDSLACLDLIPGPSILPEDTPEISSPEICPYRNKALGLLKAKYSNWGSTDFDFDAALWWAAQEGHEAVAGYLLTGGLPAKAMRQGWTALHEAALNGYNEIVQIILVNRADVSKSEDQNDEMALRCAASRGHESIVQLLLAHGADITSTTMDGTNALHKAACGGHEKVVRLLLAEGADVMTANQSGYTALHIAGMEGHEATVRLLLANGADITAADTTGNTALHWAARYGHEAISRLLLESGADITAANIAGHTALHMASYNGHEAVVRLLLTEGADVMTADKGGYTALHRAAWAGHEATIRLLLAEGGDLTTIDERGSTALHLAARYGHEAISRLLLESGADITAANIAGHTALHMASHKGHEAVVRLLLTEGAVIQTADQRGDAALHRAARKGHEGVVKLLLGNGADFRMKNLKGKTAKAYATWWKHGAIAKLLDDAEKDGMKRERRKKNNWRPSLGTVPESPTSVRRHKT